MANRFRLRTRGMPLTIDGADGLGEAHGASSRCLSYARRCVRYRRWLPTGNELEIEVDNFADPDVPPFAADFTVYGGLYRDVQLIETAPLHFDSTPDGRPGVIVENDPNIRPRCGSCHDKGHGNGRRENG